MIKKIIYEYKYLVVLAITLIILFIGYVIYIDLQYNKAVNLSLSDNATYQEIEDAFSALGNYRDSAEQKKTAQARRIEYEEETARLNAEKQEQERIIVERTSKYEKAVQLFEQGLYEQAIIEFDDLDSYLDSDQYLLESKYRLADNFFDIGEYQKAAALFESLKEFDYKDSESRLYSSLLYFMPEVQQEVFNEALKLKSAEDYYEALELLTKLDSLNYERAREQIVEIEAIITRLSLAKTISAGSLHSVAILSDGSLKGTGIDLRFWQEISEWENVISVAAGGYFTIGLNRDGTVSVVGLYDDKSWESWTEIISISAGDRFGVGLRADGQVVSFGDNTEGRRPKDTEWEDEKIIAIATGVRHTVGLRTDGTVIITGYNSTQYQNELNALNNPNNPFIAVSVGGGWPDSYHFPGKGHAVALRTDGTVVAVGDNAFSQCDVESWYNPLLDPPESRIIAVSAGDWHTVGLRADGSVISTRPSIDVVDAWNSIENNSNVIVLFDDADDWYDIIAIEGGNGFTLALRSDGTVLSCGYRRQEQRPESGAWTDVAIYTEWTYIN